MSLSLPMPHTPSAPPLSVGDEMIAVVRQPPPAEMPRYLRWSIVGAILAMTVFSRIGISIGDYTVSFALFILFFMLVKGLSDETVRIGVGSLLLYALTACVGVASFLANTNMQSRVNSSMTSLLLLATLYAPYVFVLRQSAGTRAAWLWMMRVFLNITLFCAIVGIVQFYLQFVYRPPWLFDISMYMPKLLKGSGIFNSAIPVGSLLKSNGFFFKEPSGFSFVMAFSILCEMSVFRRYRRMAVYGLGLLLSYSGTGILAFAIGLMFPFGLKTAMRVGVIAIVGLLVFLLLGDALNLSFTLSRIGEFSTESSSGYIRYVAPMRLLSELVDSDPWTAFVGHGPGTIFRAVRIYEYHDPTWAKLLFEYGLFGFAGFLMMVWFSMSRSHAPIQIRATLFINWLIMGGHLLTPESVLMIYVLLSMWPRGPEEEPALAQETTLRDTVSTVSIDHGGGGT
jgi:hypothetical protein